MEGSQAPAREPNRHQALALAQERSLVAEEASAPARASQQSVSLRAAQGEARPHAMLASQTTSLPVPPRATSGRSRRPRTKTSASPGWLLSRLDGNGEARHAGLAQFIKDIDDRTMQHVPIRIDHHGEPRISSQGGFHTWAHILQGNRFLIEKYFPVLHHRETDIIVHILL